MVAKQKEFINLNWRDLQAIVAQRFDMRLSRAFALRFLSIHGQRWQRWAKRHGGCSGDVIAGKLKIIVLPYVNHGRPATKRPTIPANRHLIPLDDYDRVCTHGLPLLSRVYGENGLDRIIKAREEMTSLLDVREVMV